MKHAILHIALLFVLLIRTHHADAQQPFSYTQYMHVLTPMVPAYSLLDQSPSVSMMTRWQWAGIEGAPETTVFTGTLPLSGHKASAGAFVAMDEVAVEKRTEVNLFFAKAVQFGKHTWFGVSLNGGFYTYKANYSSLDPSDPSYKNDMNETVGTVGFSLMLYNPEKYYIGFSIPRTSVRDIGPRTESDQRNWKDTWYLSGGYLHTLNDVFVIKPAVLVSYSKDQRAEGDLSATLYWRGQFGLGMNYRTTQEVAGILSYTYQHTLDMRYSYQLPGHADEVSGMSNGSHEVTVSYRFGRTLTSKLL